MGRAGGYHPEIAAGNPDFSTLVEVLQAFAPELLDAASSEDAELTVFAPNNDAFAGLPRSLSRSAAIRSPSSCLKGAALSSTTLRSWFRTSSRPTALFMSSEASSCRQRRRPPRARRLPTKAQIARALAMRPSGGEERLPEYEVPFIFVRNMRL